MVSHLLLTCRKNTDLCTFILSLVIIFFPNSFNFGGIDLLDRLLSSSQNDDPVFPLELNLLYFCTGRTSRNLNRVTLSLTQVLLSPT